MAERQKQVDPEVERQIALQNELEVLDYWQKKEQYWEIEPSKFPHIHKFEVALARFATSDNVANKIQVMRHVVTDQEVQRKLDLLSTQIYKESEKRLNNDLGNLQGEPDPELIRRRAALVISSDFNSSLDRAIRDGDEERIDRSNFPGLRAVDDKQILLYKMEAMDNLIGFLEKMETRFRPEQLDFRGREEEESIKVRQKFEKDLKTAKKKLLELAKKYQAME